LFNFDDTKEFYQFQPTVSEEIKPEEVLDLADVTGSVVTLEFTPTDDSLPVTVSAASLIACAEIS